jgi:hypothetical protein
MVLMHRDVRGYYSGEKFSPLCITGAAWTSSSLFDLSCHLKRYRHFGDRHQRLVWCAERKIDRTTTAPMIARREQARGSEPVSAAGRAFSSKALYMPFPAYGLYSLYQRPPP